jgi:signal transduction histidine kinase
MKLTLFSNNRDLRGAIHEILKNYPFQVFMTSEFSAAIGTADVYIWDFERGFSFPANMDWTETRRHLFLVHRRDLPAFREAVREPGVGILLKPVARPILEAFLEHASKPALAPNSLNADRDYLLQSLVDANLQLQEYDQERTNFLARAVHDFRAPLTAISGYCGLLLEGQLGPMEPEQKEVLARMDHSVRRLSRMASAMFQLSVGRVVENQPNLQPGDLRQCVEQALHEVLPLTDQKGIEILFDWITPAAMPFFERSQIEQVLINLLENACKFTPKHGTVEIKGYPCFWDRRLECNSLGRLSNRRAQETRILNAFRVDIRNSGPSIPTQYLEKIFEEYTTYSDAPDQSGGGLGLAICRSIVDGHQGRIWAENSDQGAHLSFLLPVAPRDSARVEPEREAAVLLMEG